MFLYPARTADVPAWWRRCWSINVGRTRALCPGQTKHRFMPMESRPGRNGRAFERCEAGRVTQFHGVDAAMWCRRISGGQTGSRTARVIQLRALFQPGRHIISTVG